MKKNYKKYHKSITEIFLNMKKKKFIESFN